MQGLLLMNALNCHMNSYEPAAKLKNICQKYQSASENRDRREKIESCFSAHQY